MHLDGFNLNLLVAFDALVSAPTLTEAAARLSLSQPALSGALRKLREQYDDPLIHYTSVGPRLTPLAEKLAPIVRQMLMTARDTMKLAAAFDPATADTGFDLRASDWVQLTFLKDVLGAIAIEAPRMSITVRPSPPRPAGLLFREQADLVLTSRLFLSAEHPHELLFGDSFACIAWRDNPHIREGLSAETFAALDHVGIVEGTGSPSPPDIAFRELALQRRVRIRTSVHAALPHIVLGTDLLAVTSLRFARQVAQTMPIAVLELPIAIEPIEVFAQWQPYREHDAAMLWLRAMLRRHALRLEP